MYISYVAGLGSVICDDEPFEFPFLSGPSDCHMIIPGTIDPRD